MWVLVNVVPGPFRTGSIKPSQGIKKKKHMVELGFGPRQSDVKDRLPVEERQHHFT